VTTAKRQRQKGKKAKRQRRCTKDNGEKATTGPLAKNDGHKDKKAKPRLQRQKGKDNVQTVAAAVKDELKNIDDGEKAKKNKQKGKYDALRMTAKSQRWDQWWGKDNKGPTAKKDGRKGEKEKRLPQRQRTNNDSGGKRETQKTVTVINVIEN
jgi:hypothetical protein